jgi:hypothetical protein
MIGNDKAQAPHERGVTMVNRQALNFWRLFGTTRPPKTRGEQRLLTEAAKLRWAGQRSRGKKSGPPEKKE